MTVNKHSEEKNKIMWKQKQKGRSAPLAAYLKPLVMVALILTGQVGFSESKIYHVHSDHLGTPQVLTDNEQRVVWRANYKPFGEAAVNEDPDEDGVLVEMPLRFPGQYLDKETGLHYNYFRTYDPSLGRYVQSDPIGLAGGINTYQV